MVTLRRQLQQQQEQQDQSSSQYQQQQQQQKQQRKWNGRLRHDSSTHHRLVLVGTIVIGVCLLITMTITNTVFVFSPVLPSTEAALFWNDDKNNNTDTISVHARSYNGIAPTETPAIYGVDVSFPMHHSTVSTNYAWLPHNVDPTRPIPEQYKDMVVQPLGDRQAFYDDFINDCVRANGKQGMRCKDTEHDRIDTIVRQPKSMQNYTEIGFKKIRAPEELYKLIKEFWLANKDKGSEEIWGAGNTYTNSWVSKSDLISIYDTNLRGGGENLKTAIHDAARDIISEWTGQELTPCSLYGIRAYHEGALLAPHVDRLPLVSSAILCVDQDVDEPWPLEVIGHDGRAYNVTMEPGDMVLYESHSIIHGRPYPLKGRYMANIFIHFEPNGHSARHNAKVEMMDLDQDINAKYRAAVNKGHAGHENDNDGVPVYILHGTPEEEHWKQTHPNGVKSQRKSFTTGSTDAHHYARDGNFEQLKKQVASKTSLVNAKDENGFTPLHEGVLGRHLDVVKYLVENGANVNDRTNGGGGSALWWAKRTLLEDGVVTDTTSTNVTDPIIEFLEGVGALEIGPEL